MINFQSHKNTSFTLDGSLQIIWSKGNNVGKSAIFSALEAIVRIHKYNGQKIKSLIRYGENFSKIICKYHEIIIELHMFLQNETASYFFICEENGLRTKMQKAPKSLIDALDICYQEDIDYVLNMLEADKVQIIVDETSITNGILASIFFDAKLEDIKKNAIELVKKLSEDYSFYSYSLTINERNIANYSYNTAVDTFTDMKNDLYTIAKVLDNVPNYTKLNYSLPINSNQVSDWCICLKSVYSLYSSISKILYTKCLADFNLDIIDLFIKISTLDKITPLTKKIQNMKQLEDVYSLVSAMFHIIQQIKNIRYNLQYIHKDMYEIKDIEKTIQSSGRMVYCPIKGTVIFNNEKCIPYIE